MGMIDRMREDIAAARIRDPAARSGAEVALLYPGLHAIWAHRVSHALWRRRLRLVARATSQISRWLTGIERSTRGRGSADASSSTTAWVW